VDFGLAKFEIRIRNPKLMGGGGGPVFDYEKYLRIEMFPHICARAAATGS